MTTLITFPPPVEYPDSDGQPMSDNTLQFRWITTIQGNLDGMFLHDPNVFVAGDLLWYPVEGHSEIRQAPDAMTVHGRPKGYRGSYKQWVEGGIAPQVVFEILSPGNRPEQMDRKFAFYERYGVEEYYLYDPELVQLWGWVRRGDRLEPVVPMHNFVSPRLGIRFDLSGEELVIWRPDGSRFLTFVELMEAQEREQQARVQAERDVAQEREAREQAQREAQQAQREAEQEREVREQAQRTAQRLAEKLRALGINPDE